MKKTILLMVFMSLVMISSVFAIGCGAGISTNTVLTEDISGCTTEAAIQITGSNVVLDCNGHTLTGTGINNGIQTMYGVKNTIIKNCKITNFFSGINLHPVSSNTTIMNTQIFSNANQGIYVGGSLNTIINVDSSNNNYGIVLSGGTQNRVINSVVNSNKRSGLKFYGTNNEIRDSTFSENGEWDIYLQYAWEYDPVSWCDNTFDNIMGSNNLPILYFNSPTILSNKRVSELILCNADNSNIDNIIIEGSQTKNNNGVIAWVTDNSKFNRIQSSNNFLGIGFWLPWNYITASGSGISSSRGNTVTDSTFTYNQIGLTTSYGNIISNNNIYNNLNFQTFVEDTSIQFSNNNLGNYWGHCGPSVTDLFVPGVDSTSTSAVDSWAYSAPSGWKFSPPLQPLVINYEDKDGDGYSITGGDSRTSCLTCDCDDNDATIYFGAMELCDGKDNDCDGEIDEGSQEICNNGIDEDCDGLIDEEDCSVPQGCAKILVTATNNQVLDTSNRPQSTQVPIVGRTVYLYNKECQTGQWGSCTPITSCVTNSEGKCTLNSYDGLYSAVLDYGNGIYVADVAIPVKCGTDVNSKLYLITSPTGEVLPAKSQKITGSLLEIIEPEYVIWDGVEEHYPFIFIADGDWEIDTRIYAPEGYEPDVPSIVTLVADEAQTIMFKIVEVGSIPGKAKVEYRINHRGKSQVVRSEVGMKMTPALEKSKALEASKGKAQGRAITGAVVMDAATTAVAFMGLITLVAIAGLIVVSSLALKIFLPKKKQSNVRSVRVTKTNKRR